MPLHCVFPLTDPGPGINFNKLLTSRKKVPLTRSAYMCIIYENINEFQNRNEFIHIYLSINNP